MPLHPRVLLIKVCVLCLASCASPVPHQIGELQQKAVCCESLDQMKFVPLQPDRDTSPRLDNTSPAYAFDTGKSYFAAFQLPPNLEATDLEVKTYASSGLGNGSSAFYPSFLLLDSQHRIRRALPTPGFRYNTVDTLRGQNWSIHLPLEMGDAYLVIYSSPAVFDRGLITPGSGAYVGAIGGTAFFSPGSSGGYVQLGPIGNLTLRLVKREPIRSTAGKAGKPTVPNHSAMATLSGSSVERSVFDWDGFKVMAVDGKHVDSGSTGGSFSEAIELPPGEHQILVFFGTSRGYAMRWKPDAYLRLSAKLEAGHGYRVVGSINNTLVTAWAEDAQTGNHASEQATASTYWETPFVDPDAPSE